MSQDLIADALTRIRNGQRAGHKSVKVRASKPVKCMLEVLSNEGFVERVTETVGEKPAFTEYEVVLKYYAPHEPVISRAVRVSTSGRRVYARFEDLAKVARGLGITIVSTSQGIMSDREARRRKVGGEVLASIS